MTHTTNLAADSVKLSTEYMTCNSHMNHVHVSSSSIHFTGLHKASDFTSYIYLHFTTWPTGNLVSCFSNDQLDNGTHKYASSMDTSSLQVYMSCGLWLYSSPFSAAITSKLASYSSPLPCICPWKPRSSSNGIKNFHLTRGFKDERKLWKSTHKTAVVWSIWLINLSPQNSWFSSIFHFLTKYMKFMACICLHIIYAIHGITDTDVLAWALIF